MAQALPADAAIPLPTAAQQQWLILTVLAQRGCGRRKLIGLLIADNLVVAKTLSHGGVVLDITPHGRQQLRTDTGMQQRIRA